MMFSAASGEARFGNPPRPEREIDVLRSAVAELRACLPNSWRFEADEEGESGGGDLIARLTAPDGSAVRVVVEAKKTLTSRDVPHALEQLRRYRARLPESDAVLMLIARYLPPPVRERLSKEGVAYADATGNLRLEVERPSLFLRNVGENRDPWRGPGRPRGSLKGAAAARVVRALVDFTPPYTVPEVVERSGASTGATYRVVTFLEEEGLLERERRGPVTSVQWRRLLERWSRDGGFMRSDVVRSFLLPRGVEAVPGVLAEAPELRYVLTGSLAARSFAPHAPPRVAMVYVDDVTAAAERLGLRPVDRGANVLLAAQVGDVAFERTRKVDGVVTAAHSQIAVDLLTGPGRSPSEGQAVLDWMEGHEREWRS